MSIELYHPSASCDACLARHVRTLLVAQARQVRLVFAHVDLAFTAVCIGRTGKHIGRWPLFIHVCRERERGAEMGSSSRRKDGTDSTRCSNSWHHWEVVHKLLNLYVYAYHLRVEAYQTVDWYGKCMRPSPDEPSRSA